MKFHISVWASLATLALAATPRYNGRAFESMLSKRQSTSGSGLTVDLGYEQYMGVANASTGLNTWKGYVCVNIIPYQETPDPEITGSALQLHPQAQIDGSLPSHQP